MIVTFKNAITTDDYKLKVTMTNGNCITIDFKPYLNTIEFCELKNIEVWKNVEVHDTYLLWKGSADVMISIDTILAYFKSEVENI